MSLGGLTAIALVREAPELVRRLILVDVVPGLEGTRANHVVDFVNGPPTFASLDELVERTALFNPNRSISSLRRGILQKLSESPLSGSSERAVSSVGRKGKGDRHDSRT